MKLDSSTVPYVQRLSVAFFSGVEETSAEFAKAFSGAGDAGNDNHRTSAFLTWIDEEIEAFCQRVEKQVLQQLIAPDGKTQTFLRKVCCCFLPQLHFSSFLSCEK